MTPAPTRSELEQAQQEVARLRALNGELTWLLTRIISDLPSRRDWLDPDLERRAKAAILRAKEAAHE